jgi:transcriptional regulator with XRE-family HTH domain
VAKGSAQHIDAVVGSNIRLARLEQGLSLTVLGGRIGVSSQQIQKYESGTNRVGASRLSKIAEALDLPIHALFGSGRGLPNRTPTYVPVDTLLTRPDALRLLRAFDKINAGGVRVAALHLVEAVGETPIKRTRRPAARRDRRRSR